jgi:hypothetical protein
MNTRRRHSHLALIVKPGLDRTLGLLGVVVVVAPAILATPTSARASPFTYTLENADASFQPGQVTFTGTFTFDPDGPTLVQVMITAAGTTPPLVTTPELYDVPVQAVSDFQFRAGTPSNELILFFQNPLDGAADPLSSALILNQNQIVEYLSTTITGSAVPVPVPVPGPIASLALMAIGLFFLRPMANRRDRQAHTDQPEVS